MRVVSQHRAAVVPRAFVVLVVAATAVLLSGCSPSRGDFVSDAEAFLRSDEMFDTYGLDLPEPACTAPAEIETGATISCTGTAQDDVGYTFTFEITGSRDLTLRAIAFTDG